MKFNYFGKNTEKEFNRCLVITSFDNDEISKVEKACHELGFHTVSVSELFENDEKEVYAVEVVADFDNIKDAKEIYKEIKELVKSVANENATNNEKAKVDNKKGIYKVRVGKKGIEVSYGEATYEKTTGKLHVYIYRKAFQYVASKSVFDFMMTHKATTLKNGDFLYKANWEKETTAEKEENTMTVLENAIETTTTEQKEENTMNIIEKALERTEQETKTAWCIVDEDVNLMTAKHETLENAIDDFVQQIESKVTEVWNNKIHADIRDIQDTIETYGATACLIVFDELDRIRGYKETINSTDLIRMIKEKKEVNTMNVLEKALATTEKKTRERRHYFATKGRRGISIFSNSHRPVLYVFSTWIARKKWIEDQETSVDIAVMERTATECKQAYSHIVDGVREWDTDVYFM